MEGCSPVSQFSVSSGIWQASFPPQRNLSTATPLPLADKRGLSDRGLNFPLPSPYLCDHGRIHSDDDPGFRSASDHPSPHSHLPPTQAEDVPTFPLLKLLKFGCCLLKQHNWVYPNEYTISLLNHKILIQYALLYDTPKGLGQILSSRSMSDKWTDDYYKRQSMKSSVVNEKPKF